MTLIWSSKIIKTTITSDRIKLNVWMKQNYPSLTISHLHKLCRKGEIRINGKRTTATTPLLQNDELKLPPFIVEYTGTPDIKSNNYSKKDITDILNAIIFEDDEIIVLNKPSGLATQGGTNTTKHIDELINIALPEHNNNLRLTHRIDMQTSGVLVIAKNYEAALKITTLFKEQKITKTYLALTYQSFNEKEKQGIIKVPIMAKKYITDAKSGRKVEIAEKKYALTNYKILDEAMGLLSLVELEPKTGRTHQLRIHMAHLNHPIIGDFKYATSKEFDALKESLDVKIEKKLYLHAYKIEIEGKPIITAPLPSHFKTIYKYLNF